MIPTFLTILLLPLLAGCDGFRFTTVCTSEARPGIVAGLVDDASGLPILRGPGRVTAVSAARADTVWLPDGVLPPRPVALAEEAGGLYRVEARVAGYQPWGRDDVDVTSDGCHVRTVEITVRLRATG
jgi:hypothetical protein